MGARGHAVWGAGSGYCFGMLFGVLVMVQAHFREIDGRGCWCRRTFAIDGRVFRYLGSMLVILLV